MLDFFIDLICSLLSLLFTGQAFSSRRPSQVFRDSGFIKVEDEVQSVVVNAVHELSTEKVRDGVFFPFCFCRIVCNKLFV